MTYTIGSLCTGVAGLEMAAELVFGPLEHAWHAENAPDAASVLRAHYPDVPNHGDITAIDFAGLPAVDILCAGYPCQGESNAGLRKGADDPRFRWPDVYRGVRTLRPGLVILENVASHIRRSFPRVLADLAAAGYVGSWSCVRASDVGAPHARDRVNILAWPADTDPRRWADLAGGWQPETGGRSALTLLPTPTSRDGSSGPGHAASAQGGMNLRTAVTLLPTPTAVSYGTNMGGAAGRVGKVRPSLDTLVRDMALLPTPSARDGRRGAGWGDQPGRPLSETVHRLLPTPTVNDSRNGRNATAGRSEGAQFNTGWTLSDVAHAKRWGEYAAAIARWEQVLGRPAPEPMEPGRLGKPRLSPAFVEWMMGYPAGHVTDPAIWERHRETLGKRAARFTPATARNAQLRLLGNGVVPAQLAHGICTQLAALPRAVAA